MFVSASNLQTHASAAAFRSHASTSHPHASATRRSLRMTGARDGLNKTACVYASDHVSMLDTFSAAVGRPIQCALVFNDASPTWHGWETPWFDYTYPDMNWAAWATARGTDRHLIITQSMFPTSETHAHWLTLGASGAFNGHARALARNLVATGLGSAVIRLGNEANGSKYDYSIPDTASGDRKWVRFWDNIVSAMRSVPGAHFLFDWCVASGYRSIPLTSFYPGNRYVDIIGVDVYDSGLRSQASGQARWSELYDEPDGVGAVAEFAAAHHKPISIPEWGLEPRQQPRKGYPGGDDPAFVNGIAAAVKHDDVAFQSYFDADYEGPQLFNSPRALAAYRRHFGHDGDAVRTSGTDTQRLTPFPAPRLRITGGPADGSTDGSAVRFTFSLQPGYTAQCSLDGAPFSACSSAGSDDLTNLSPGFHTWRVQAKASNGATTYLGRAFVAAATASVAHRRRTNR